jgi:hypothetical protein
MRMIALPVVILAVVFAAGACIMPYNGPGDIRRDIQSVTGKEYDRSFALTVGRTGMALARWAIRKWDEDDIPIEGIRKVEIGIYEVRDGSLRHATGSSISSSQWPDWSPMVEMRGEGGENILVLSEAKRNGSIKRLLIVVDEEDELMIVRLTGRLDDFMEQAMAYAFDQADRPDLTDPVLEEYRRSEEVAGDQVPAEDSQLMASPSGSAEGS